jgi:starch synthase
LTILFITPEAVPFAKTGGLADVAGIMPAVMARSENVSLIMPGYRTDAIGESRATAVDEFMIRLGAAEYPAVIARAAIPAAFPAFFVMNDHFFARESLYGDNAGDYPDNFQRFLFFQRAVLEFIRRNGLHFDIIHCNDWQTALIPAYMRTVPHAQAFADSRIVFSIHNLGYQGVFLADSFEKTDLPANYFSPEYLEFYGKLNCLKSGIIFSDRLITVSPTYAKEILLPENGHGLDGLLRKHSRKLLGILNGVDYSRWDPAIDPFLSHRYSSTAMTGKAENKAELLSEFGIMNDGRAPLIAMISRITEQKGVALLLELLPLLLQEELHFIFLGVGDRPLTEKLRDIAGRHARRMTFLNRFDEKMAHRLEAAADILFMPSVYEPCGLNQIYAMKYGTVPVVRATGGLDDSVQEFAVETRRGTGFKFREVRVEDAIQAIKAALRCYADGDLWKQIQNNGMKMDFSWDRVAPEYLRLYSILLSEEPQYG